MLGKILPLLLLLIGTGAGVGAGMFLRPAPEIEEMAETEITDASAEETAETKNKSEGHEQDDEELEFEYVKMNNQFVIPVVKEQVIIALVVLALSIEVPPGNKEAVFRMEPKLRDSFLQVLFDHANIGGFDGAFTSASNMSALRNALREAGQRDIGADIVRDVLILEIARQDY